MNPNTIFIPTLIILELVVLGFGLYYNWEPEISFGAVATVPFLILICMCKLTDHSYLKNPELVQATEYCYVYELDIDKYKNQSGLEYCICCNLVSGNYGYKALRP